MNEMQYSVVKMSRVRESHPDFRLEAEFFKPLFLSIEDKLANDLTLFDVQEQVICGPFGSTILDETYCEEGVKVIRPFNINDCQIENRNLVYISEEDIIQKGLKLFGPETIFFARVGDVKCGIFLEQNLVTISPNIIAVNIDRARTNPYFLTIFFNSYYGIKQLERQLKTTSQPTISTEYLQYIRIPTVSIKFIDQIEILFKRAIQSLMSAEECYQQAHQSLLTHLSIDNWRPAIKKSFAANYSEVLEASRYDAGYFQPHYKDLLLSIKAPQTIQLGHLVTFQKGIEVGSEAYEKSGVPFIRVSDVSEHGVERHEKRISPKLYEELKDDYAPMKRDVLFTKDGTIGRSFSIQNDIEAILSSAFLKLRIRQDFNLLEDYLALVLNSIVCKFQIDRLSGGAIISHLKPSDAMSMEIPILDGSVQNDLCNLIAKSRTQRHESKKYIWIAKQAVNKAIEEDEPAAFKFIEQEFI